MCLIIEMPKGKTVEPAIVESARRHNNDGIGIMHSGKFDKWLDISTPRLIEKLDSLKDIDSAVHFRMATHGTVNTRNAHPFKLVDGSVLMHNGVIHGYTPSKWFDKGKSDTRVFIERWVNPHIRQNKCIIKEMIEQESGFDAFLHMNPEGEMTRYGTGWLQYDGCMFSNSYAWDYPYSQSHWTGASHNESYVDDYFDTDYSNIAVGESIREYLYAYIDYIPFDKVEMHHSDTELLNSYLDSQISASTFVDTAHYESVVSMFIVLAHNERLPSPNYYK